MHFTEKQCRKWQQKRKTKILTLRPHFTYFADNVNERVPKEGWRATRCSRVVGGDETEGRQCQPVGMDGFFPRQRVLHVSTAETPIQQKMGYAFIQYLRCLNSLSLYDFIEECYVHESIWNTPSCYLQNCASWRRRRQQQQQQIEIASNIIVPAPLLVLSSPLPESMAVLSLFLICIQSK